VLGVWQPSPLVTGEADEVCYSVVIKIDLQTLILSVDVMQLQGPHHMLSLLVHDKRGILSSTTSSMSLTLLWTNWCQIMVGDMSL